MKWKLIFGIAVAALAVTTTWQVVANYASNAELQSDLRQVAAQNGTKIGLDAPQTDDDLKDAVIRRAYEHGVILTREQITVRRSERESSWNTLISADYDAPVAFPGFTYKMRFTPLANH